MRKTHDIVAKIKQEGRDKPNYVRCGVAFTRDDGSVALKLDSVPVGAWDGWLNLYEPRDDKPAAPAAPARRPAKTDDGLDIPF